MVPAWVKPPELNSAMLSLAQVPLLSWVPPRSVWKRPWNWVVAPAEIAPGLLVASSAGEPIVLAVPWSPVEVLTNVPPAAARRLNCATTSWVDAGSGSEPNDSFSTLTWSTATAHDMPWMMFEVNVKLDALNTFIATSDAPGETPTSLMLQPTGSFPAFAVAWNFDRS